MKQLIIKNGEVHCETKVAYSADTIKSMKSAGYTVKTIKDSNDTKVSETTKQKDKTEEINSLW